MRVTIFHGAPVPIDDEDASEIDSALYGSSNTDFIHVNRARMDEFR